jgi:hypothetical protein
MRYKTFYTYILSLGFVRRKDDQCIYSKEEGRSFIYAALYVDDMFFIGNNINTIKEVKKKISSEFNMKYISVENFILGMDIKRDRETTNIWLNQEKYIETILKRFNM